MTAAIITIVTVLFCFFLISFGKFCLTKQYEHLRGGGLPSLKLKVDAKKPKGNDPIPNDI